MNCSHHEVDPWLHFVFWFIFWNFVKGGVAVCVEAAGFLLVGVLGFGFSRVVLRLDVGVFEFAVAALVESSDS